MGVDFKYHVQPHQHTVGKYLEDKSSKTESEQNPKTIDNREEGDSSNNALHSCAQCELEKEKQEILRLTYISLEKLFISPSCLPTKIKFPSYHKLAAETIKYYIEIGDIVMSYTIASLFHTQIEHLISPNYFQNITNSFIDFLGIYMLWSPRSLAIKTSSFIDIKKMSQSMTCYSPKCGKCGDVLLPATSRCEKCSCRFICSVCGLPAVKGLMFWCKICGHGGHLKHFKAWFSVNEKCPGGCNHNCKL